MGERSNDRSWQVFQILALLMITGGVYWLLAPATINGDGIGYLKQLQSSEEISPGHISFLPIARQVAALVKPRVALDMVAPLRVLSLGSALLGLLLLYFTARQLFTHRQALFSTVILAVSNAYLRASHEVEVYGITTLVVIVTLWAVVRYRASEGTSLPMLLIAAIATGFAPTLHLTLVLLAPSVLLLLWLGGRRPSHLILALITAGTVGFGILALALQHQGVSDPIEALRWLRSSDHGIPYPASPLVVLTGAWGLAKSLVRIPYLYEATLAIVIALTLLAVAVWLTLLRCQKHARKPGDHSAPLGDLRFVLIWATPLTLFALLFYPSDTERWVFIMPVLALYLAPAASRLGAIALAVAAVANAGQAIGPAVDNRAPRRARIVDAALSTNDLVVSPGHGWTEMVGLCSPDPPRRYPLIFFVGAKRDRDTAVADMHDRIRETFDAGGRVFVARLRDDADARGFKELARFGIRRAGFARLFVAYRPRPSKLDGLWQLQR